MEEYTIRTPENGDPTLLLLEIKAKAESQTTDSEEIDFKIVSGKCMYQVSASNFYSSLCHVLIFVLGVETFQHPYREEEYL